MLLGFAATLQAQRVKVLSSGEWFMEICKADATKPTEIMQAGPAYWPSLQGCLTIAPSEQRLSPGVEQRIIADTGCKLVQIGHDMPILFWVQPDEELIAMTANRTGSQTIKTWTVTTTLAKIQPRHFLGHMTSWSNMLDQNRTDELLQTLLLQWDWAEIVSKRL